MAGNTKSYRVTVNDDGTLHAEMVEFSPKFADTIANALMRLHERAHLQPPHVKFTDWEELQRRWQAEGGTACHQ